MTGIQIHTLDRPPGLVECQWVIDVGAGLRPFSWYRPGRHICVEPYEPYAAVLESAGYEVVRATAEQALGPFTADAVYLLDVLEHMTREEGERVLMLARQAASVQVVVYTPVGFVDQTRDAWDMGGDYWQTHRSGWMPKDFPQAHGWRTHFYMPEDTKEREGFYAIWDRFAHV